MIFVTDGRTATQRATEMGIANVVLIDLALDYATATRIAVGAAINCFAPAVGAAISLLQAAGFEVCRLATPGTGGDAHRRDARQRSGRRGQPGCAMPPAPMRR